MTLSSNAPPEAVEPPRPDGFFGHPRGLATLFSTEMWERFSFGGMRALLFLYMTCAVADGGLGLPVAVAGSIAGTYGALLFVGSVLGGWLSDRVIGPRRAVLYGGLVIMLGHVSLSRPGAAAFALGMALLLLGSSLFKPSMINLVGLLYAPGDRRRDAGFSIFYMGISLGSLLAPLVAGSLAQSERWKHVLVSHGLRPESSWHWGFGAAAVGMALGLAQYVWGARHLGGIGLRPKVGDPAAHQRLVQRASRIAAAALGLLLTVYAAHARGYMQLDVGRLSKWLGYCVLAAPFLYIPFLLLSGRPTPRERKQMSVVVILFVFMILFWAAEGQAGSSLLLFAQRHVNNAVLGHAFPSTWWQSASPVFIIVLTPLLGGLWLRLGRLEPSGPMKLVLGLFFAGAGFLLLTAAALLVSQGVGRVSPAWLLGVYFLHTVGEACLGPVGLSLVTRLTPPSKGSQMLGVWFLAVSVGSVLGGAFVGLFERLPLPGLFGAAVAALWAAALLLLLLRSTIKRLMG